MEVITLCFLYIPEDFDVYEEIQSLRDSPQPEIICESFIVYMDAINSVPTGGAGKERVRSLSFRGGGRRGRRG